MYATIAKASELHAVAVRDTRLKRKPANEQRVAKVQGSAEGLREARASKNKDNGPPALARAAGRRRLYRLRRLRSPRLDQLDGSDCGWLKGFICYW